MAGCQSQPLRRHQVDEGVGHGWQVLVHRVDHRFILMRARDREHARMRGTDHVFLDAEAAGDDDAAVLAQRLPDGLEALALGAVEEAAGIDEHDIGAGIVARKGIALRAQRRHDAFGIDEGLGAAEADKADFRGLGHLPGVILQRAQRSMRARLTPALRQPGLPPGQSLTAWAPAGCAWRCDARPGAGAGRAR